MASSVKLYTVKEAQEILQVAQRTLYVYLETGALKAVKVGKFWRIPADALDAFLATGAPVQDKNRRKQNQAEMVMTGRDVLEADAAGDAGRTWRVKAHLEAGAWTHDYFLEGTLAEIKNSLASCGLPFVGTVEFHFYSHSAEPGQDGCAADKGAADYFQGADAGKFQGTDGAAE